jgi:hypothetical protein
VLVGVGVGWAGDAGGCGVSVAVDGAGVGIGVADGVGGIDVAATGIDALGLAGTAMFTHAWLIAAQASAMRTIRSPLTTGSYWQSLAIAK